jgi:hypothetical protein
MKGQAGGAEFPSGWNEHQLENQEAQKERSIACRLQ